MEEDVPNLTPRVLPELLHRDAPSRVDIEDAQDEIWQSKS